MGSPSVLPTGNFADQYDHLVLDPFMRRFFGPAGYFNVGYWVPGVASQEEACRNLTDRLIAKLPQDVGTVLDAGCGLGSASRRLSQLRPRAHILALNLSLNQLAHCRTNCPEASLLQADAARTGLATGCLDAIFCLEAALHFRTRADFLTEASRILKPGGIMLIADILFVPGVWSGAWTVPPENYLEGPNDYCELLRRSAFTTIEIEDATEPCWRCFCHKLGNWLDENQSTIDPAIMGFWKTMAQDLLSAVRHYLLISAVSVCARE